MALGVGHSVHDHLVRGHKGVRDRTGDRGHQGRTVPHQGTVGRGSRHVSSKGQVRERGANAGRAVVHVGERDARQSQQGQLVHTVGQPVGQAVAAGFAEVDHRLLIGQLALVADAVGDQVDVDDLAVGLQRFFVAFALVVADHAVRNQVGHQEHQHLFAALGLGQLGDALNHCVVARADELLDEHLVASGLPDVTTPNDFLLSGEPSEIGQHGVGPPKVVLRNGVQALRSHCGIHGLGDGRGRRVVSRQPRTKAPEMSAGGLVRPAGPGFSTDQASPRRRRFSAAERFSNCSSVIVSTLTRPPVARSPTPAFS